MNINEIELNILIGSILGDGSLALYGRSKNAFYREHFSIKQLEYRQWKLNKLCSLNLKITLKDNYGNLLSNSATLYTELYNLFYINKIKTLTKDNLKLITHPIALACLYLDDGTLIIDSTTRKNGIKYLFPRINIFTFCFSKEEIILLVNKLYELFNIQFKLKKMPYGKGYAIEINKRDQIQKFITLISPYVNQIPSMTYKVDIKTRLNEALEKNINSTLCPLCNTVIRYSDTDVELMLKLKFEGKTYIEIAEIMDRTYDGVVNKFRTLKKSET